jgi:pimeloyl-ACP methyl ester carboxylesterase
MPEYLHETRENKSMKRLYLLVCIFSLFGSCNLLANLNTGLVAYYPFNGNANDASGNGNNGIVNGATLTADRFGNPNSAYSFNGSSDYIRVPNSNSLQLTNDFTLTAWINCQSFAGVTQDILTKHMAGPNFDGTWIFQLFQTGAIEFEATPSFYYYTYSDTSPSIGNWHQVTFTYSKASSDWNIYIDGALNNSGIQTYDIEITTNDWFMGVQITGLHNTQRFENFFNGCIDDIRIYNRVLCGSEVQSLYTRDYLGTAPTPPTLTPTNRTPTSAEIGSQTNGVLRMFTNGAFTNVFNLDPNKMTIVLTHGWNDNSDGWPSNMASQFVTAGISANIVAWDWRVDAKQTLPQTALLNTPAQGFELGTNLLQILGAGYSQPIHFIGHSFGTEVNAAAANYLETNGYSSGNIQMTLFDEAEIANDLRIVSPTTWNLGWIKPLPNSFAWSDNYISLVGELQENPNTVNVILTEGQPSGFYINASNLWNALVACHAVPCQWYAQTIANPSGSVMGDIWSFERNSNFTSPAGGTFFDQQGSGLGLSQIPQAIAEYLYCVNAVSFKRDLGVLLTLEGANAGINYAGDVTANVIEWSLSDPNPVFQTTPATIGISTYAPASPDFWSPQLVLQNHPVSVQPNSKSAGIHPLDNPSPTPSNSPAYAWLPMTIPTNVTSMSFDFMLQGNGANDSVAAALNGTNVFSLAASLIQTNVTMNSGLIDVSQYAGTNIELFLGIVGGTSTNASLTVSGIRLYSIAPPSLQAQVSSTNIAVTWPLSAQNFNLQTTTNITDPNSWTTLTNVSAIVNLQNVITNPITEGQRFYRLKQ